MADMTPREFIRKWRLVELKERSMAQEHFLDICRMVGHPTPAEADPKGEWFVFEAGADKTAGGQGWADVWKRGFFAWEYKGPDRDLDAAYNQLLQYRESLQNPPLLVVSDHHRFRIHTNWTNTVKRVHEFTLEDLADVTAFNQLKALFFEPEALNPREHPETITKRAASKFAELAEELRQEGHAPQRVAHFLTQVLFCLFAEDIGLLPRGPKGEAGILSEILQATRFQNRAQFPVYVRELFRAMGTSGGNVLLKPILYFDGGLFDDDEPWTPELSSEQINHLYDASRLDWSSIEPSIFGTLFERGLDPAKRSQIGAHYTSREDIKVIVEPVLMAPLRREWDELAEELPVDANAPLPPAEERQQMRDGFLERLGSVRVLDPACGSGNFLYVSLGLLKDMEKRVITHPAFEDLPEVEPCFVTPGQLYGIELSEYAHELASVVVWIGYIQWFRNNGYRYEQTPVLQALDTIECKDAILGVREDGTLFKPEWPEADVIVGNPPFLGARKLRAGLGDEYVDSVFDLYAGDIHHNSDLVCYWFARALDQLSAGLTQRVGLLATQAIRTGDSRGVLDQIAEHANIFFAYSNREWILDGAAVRISMIGFDSGQETQYMLDGEAVSRINADLTSHVDLTVANRLVENGELSFQGGTKVGPFDINNELAQRMLSAPLNPHGRPNSDVLRRYVIARDITQRSRNMWIIDFGVDMSLEEAALYEAPFEYAKKHVEPYRETARSAQGLPWWLHRRPAPDFRAAVAPLHRYIATPRVSKHRIFVWMDGDVLVDSRVVAIAREDNYFFGVLHSKLHELWSIEMGAWHGKGNDPTYTPTTTFETYPFPWPPGQEPTDDPHYQAIAEAARELNEKREAWLNPPRGERELDLYEKTLKKRTLTNLYNQMPTWLQHAHEKLDLAVFAAYGWDYDELHDPETGEFDEDEILRRLLALNLERGSKQAE